MSSTLSASRPVDARRIGALVGAAFGFFVIAVGYVLQDASGRATTMALGFVVLVLAVPLGWIFARKAMQPGLRSALSAAAGVTALAVPLGALLIGMLLVVNGQGRLEAGEAVLAGLVLAFVGLLFFGLPLAGLTFVTASIWVAVLRLLVGGRREISKSS